jgi:hypothetical protein
LPNAETVKLLKCLPKLALKKEAENADKSDNRQIFATPVSKTNIEKKPPKLSLREGLQRLSSGASGIYSYKF